MSPTLVAVILPLSVCAIFSISFHTMRQSLNCDCGILCLFVHAFWYYPKHCYIPICLPSWSFGGIGFLIKQQSWIYPLSLCNGVQVFLRFPFAQDHTHWNLLCWFSFKFCRLSRFPKNRFSDIWSHVYKEIAMLFGITQNIAIFYKQ